MPEKLRPTFTFSEERLRELAQVVPEAFAEGKINWDTLREALGEYLEDETQEHFGLFWPGKREARRLAALPPKGTLTPAPGEGVNEDQTRNLFIEGENLEVLKLLQKSYAGRVKMIYIDPPYNTGNDFIYPDDYSEPLEAYLKRTGQMDEAGRRLTTNTKASGRFHSNWLNMIYPRLLLARQLLREDGVIFVSIDDNEVHNLREVMDEVFGEENFIDAVIWKKRYGGGAKEKYLVTLHEYILFYAKDAVSLVSLYVPLTREAIDRYYKLKDDNFEKRGPYRTHPLEATKSMGARPNLVFPIPAPDGTEVWPERQWLWSRERTFRALENNELEFVKGKDGEWKVHTKQYLRDEAGKMREAKAFSIIDNVFTQHGTNEIIDIFGDAQIFAFPKPTGLIIPLLQLATNVEENDIVLDFFSGSCATADAILQQNRQDGGNRQFIMVQLPEPLDPKRKEQKAAADFCDQIGKPRNVADIGKERIRRAIAKMQAEREGQMDLSPDEDLGFKVFRLARTHYKDWQPVEPLEPAQLDDLFAQHTSPLVDGWTQEGLLTENLLLEGFPLDSQVISLADAFSENDVWRVHHPDVGHDLFVCLDEALRPSTVDRLKTDGILRKDDIFICLDAALTDEAKVVLDDRIRLKVI